jgi:hypothetical protein
MVLKTIIGAIFGAGHRCRCPASSFTALMPQRHNDKACGSVDKVDWSYELSEIPCSHRFTQFELF